MSEFKYIMFDKSEYSKLNLSELLVNCAEPVRISQTTQNGYVKYIGNMPSSVSLLNSKSDEYSKTEIAPFLQNENWRAGLPEF